MSHILKRTKKSCIKLIRKLSTKQIFLKRLEEEDISTDIDPSVEATEKPNNQNSNTTTPSNAATSYHRRQTSKRDTKDSPKHKQAKNAKTLKDLDEDDDEDETPDTAILQSLTSKLFLTADGYEFQRLEQLRSDTASEIIPFDANFSNTNNSASIKKPPPSSFADDINLEVVFEKVKYKEDVRYFRHTPSTASLDNYFINDQELNLITSNSNCSNGSNGNNNNSNNHHNHNHNNNNNSNAINLNNPIFTNRGLEMTHHNYFNSQHHLNHLLPVNVSLGCKSDGNYHQFIIGQERDCFYKLTPVVKWDINGNSLDDDMDNFHCFSINSNNSPAKSSLRSSSTTLETWLEDE